MLLKRWSSNQVLEYWKDIEGYDNYMVSDLGRVKSLNYRHTGKEKIMKLKTNNDGYLQVNLFKNGKRKMFYVHRLVATAFIPNDNSERDSIDHINTIKTDNRVCNLRWCTHKENLNNPLSRKKNRETRKGKHHSDETKKILSEKTQGENNPRAKKVKCLETDEVFDCIKYAREWAKTGSSSIIKQIKGEYKYAGKHPETGQKLTWEYIE